MPDIFVDTRVRADLNQGLGLADTPPIQSGGLSDAPLAGAINRASGDGSISRNEIEAIVRDSFRTSGDAFIRARTDALWDRITGIAGQNGNASIDQLTEVTALVEFASSAEAHRTAGGAIVRKWPGSRTLEVELYCPTLTEGQFRETLQRYELFRRLGNIPYSFTTPVVQGQTDQFYTFTMATVDVVVDTMHWPAVTLLTLSRQGNQVRAEWQLVPSAQLRAVVDANRAGFATALQAARLDHSDHDVQVEMNRFVNDADSVTRSTGFYHLDLSSGILLYHNSSVVSLGRFAPEDRLIRTALENALITCGDSRAGTRPHIPSWTYTGSVPTPVRTTIQPAD